MLYNYKRRQSTEVRIGDTPMGAHHPIRLQSMTNTNTLDTETSVAQTIRIIESGAEYVRLTAQGVREAENLHQIHQAIRLQGYNTPLVADIHFNPRAADTAAQYVEKVRINPGNYAEFDKIRERFIPFLQHCSELKRAIRIGVNHGSLSERIMNQYGDTPEGMVASCLEFLRICVEQNFYNVVLSIKASNTVVMVRTVRLLVQAMELEEMAFPLHLGVTEAGDGEDGRIKSALGIGALLTDGYGDTIRVSLSEEPEMEIPVARKLVQHVIARQGHAPIQGPAHPLYNPIDNPRRQSNSLYKIGNQQIPVVIADYTRSLLLPNFDLTTPLTPDYWYLGARNSSPFSLLPATRILIDATNPSRRPGNIACYNVAQLMDGSIDANEEAMLIVNTEQGTPQLFEQLAAFPKLALLLQSENAHLTGAERAFIFTLQQHNLLHPVVLHHRYAETDIETLQVKAAADLGSNLIDRLADGIMLSNSEERISAQQLIHLAFGTLQAARLRTSKTEYISCPGCGRTLFDLAQTIARVKAATAHLSHLKIGIMGCIVNGPGEMADADYGYVGADRGKISLYKGKNCIEKNIPEAEAVTKLIELIKANEDWKEQ